MPERLKHIGVDSFFAQRDELLNAFDKAKKQAADDAVKTEHGTIGEAEVRTWLETFLPKRFGVCKGYIITTNLQFAGPLDEWDVIVYDAIEAPILFTRGPSDPQAGETKRAIPVEHVRGIMEVKATLTPEMARRCVAKLRKLGQYLGLNADSPYPKYLCEPFVANALFFDAKPDNLQQYRRALDHFSVLYCQEPMIPFMGALVLRSPHNPGHNGYLQAQWSEEPISYPDVFEMSSPFQYPDGAHGVFGTLSWGVNNYPMFLFDFLAFLRGTRTNRVSSFYGMDFENTAGSRLFRHKKEER